MTKQEKEKKLSIKPLGDRVLVEMLKADEKKSASGIIIPEGVEKGETVKGLVMAVGMGRYEDGKLIPIQIKVGDKVLFNEYSASKIKIDSTEYHLVPESSILAVVK